MIERLKRLFVLEKRREMREIDERDCQHGWADTEQEAMERQVLEARVAELKQELEECRGRMFERGWIAAAVWAGRDDLIADSPEYLKETLR